MTWRVALQVSRKMPEQRRRSSEAEASLSNGIRLRPSSCAALRRFTFAASINGGKNPRRSQVRGKCCRTASPPAT